MLKLYIIYNKNKAMVETDPTTSGRNFKQVAIGKSQAERIAAIQPGDYIEMLGRKFDTWYNIEKTNSHETLDKRKRVQVRVLEIIEDGNGERSEVVVAAENVRKKINISLFLNNKS